MYYNLFKEIQEDSCSPDTPLVLILIEEHTFWLLKIRGWLDGGGVIGVEQTFYIVDTPDDLGGIDPDLTVTPDVTDPDHSDPGRCQEWSDSSHEI